MILTDIDYILNGITLPTACD